MIKNKSPARSFHSMLDKMLVLLMALNKNEDYKTANTSDPVDLDFYIRELHSWED